jgi:hypothetical protein
VAQPMPDQTPRMDGLLVRCVVGDSDSRGTVVDDGLSLPKNDRGQKTKVLM